MHVFRQFRIFFWKGGDSNCFKIAFTSLRFEGCWEGCHKMSRKKIGIVENGPWWLLTTEKYCILF